MAAYRRTHGPSRPAWSEGWRPTGAEPHSSDEPSELSKWLCHDDSTINIVLSIIIIIIIIINYYYVGLAHVILLSCMKPLFARKPVNAEILADRGVVYRRPVGEVSFHTGGTRRPQRSLVVSCSL